MRHVPFVHLSQPPARRGGGHGHGGVGRRRFGQRRAAREWVGSEGPFRRRSGLRRSGSTATVGTAQREPVSGDAVPAARSGRRIAAPNLRPAGRGAAVDLLLPGRSVPVERERGVQAVEADTGGAHPAADVEKVHQGAVATVSADLDHSQLAACKWKGSGKDENDANKHAPFFSFAHRCTVH